MRGFLALVYKEWRDIRVVTFVAMALVPIAAAVTRWLLGAVMVDTWASSPHAARFTPVFVPAAAGFYGAMVAADLVGGETASRRIDQLALLPVGPAKVWLAKVSQLFVATSLFAMWAIVVQAVTLAVVDGQGHVETYLSMLQSAEATLFTVVGVAAALVCVLLVSTLGLRGITAVLGGGFLAATLLAATRFLPGLLLTDLRAEPGAVPSWFQSPSETLAIVAFGVVATFLTAALAFVFGRVHLGRRLRVCAIALAVLLPTVAAPSVVIAQKATTLTIGSDWVQVETLDVSPCGQYLAVGAWNRCAFGVSIIDLATGESRLVARNATINFPASWSLPNWDAEGRLHVTRLRGGPLLDIAIEPKSGRVIESVAVDQAERSAMHKKRFDAYLASRSAAWKITKQQTAKSADGLLYHATIRHGDAVVELDAVAPVALLGDGFRAVYCPDADRLVLRDLVTGEERTVVSRVGQLRGARIAAIDGRGTLTINLRTQHAMEVIDVSDGRSYMLPADVNYAYSLAAIPGGALRSGHRVLHLVGGRGSALFDMDAGAISEWAHDGFDRECELPDGRLLAHASGTIVIYDRQLTRTTLAIHNVEGDLE